MLGLVIGVLVLIKVIAFLLLYGYHEAREDRRWSPHVPNQLLVKFRDEVDEQRRKEIVGKARCEVLRSYDVLGTHLIRSKRKMRRMLKHYQQLYEVEYAEPNYVFQSSYKPNDPYFETYQYGLKQVNAPAAWDVTQGAPMVRVAVVDTGVQLGHRDLEGKLAPGRDFVGGDDAPEDSNGHGTHVAGIAAAATNNALGVSGMAPLATIMPVRVLDASGSGTLEQVAQGVVYAAQQGAQVINLSLGAPATSTTLRNAVRFAWSQGAVLVAAAGNEGSSAPSYPANYDEVIAVASTNAQDVKSVFSNFGPWVDVAAPGEAIFSTYLGSSYAYLSGTSMAAPLVSGLAALLAAQGRTNAQIRSAILGSADPILGTGTYWRYGRVNAERAVKT
ncbi:peptidase S8 [Paenibacillus athensensis]|uniref:Alkaline serine protease n=1 Tax=Paenibacillus athensensis TaxID=1967502 RepID=A0A4Y8Q9P5_9BACL|nr:S8 family peptidase [Paenibacillus athensensis]MCD1260110.1 peptidase S8 [Paenibacillus athensensis]